MNPPVFTRFGFTTKPGPPVNDTSIGYEVATLHVAGSPAMDGVTAGDGLGE
ncbi:MAG: hypothetical protein HY556_02210 [Euryarchaeota archaeon]|nr:hypothetical protein [Euryarchaeota archaeon]